MKKGKTSEPTNLQDTIEKSKSDSMDIQSKNENTSLNTPVNSPNNPSPLNTEKVEKILLSAYFRGVNENNNTGLTPFIEQTNNITTDNEPSTPLKSANEYSNISNKEDSPNIDTDDINKKYQNLNLISPIFNSNNQKQKKDKKSSKNKEPLVSNNPYRTPGLK